VLALGNVLMGDDALGPHVIENLLATHEFPPEVTIQDLGTPGLDLHPFLADCDVLIIVDTVRTKGQPGDLRLYHKDDILRHAPQPRLSPHDPGLKEALLSLEFASSGPEEVLLVGVIPARTGSDIGLSAVVHQAVPHAAAAVLAELDRLGHAVTQREVPRATNIWWETGVSPGGTETTATQHGSGPPATPQPQAREATDGGADVPLPPPPHSDRTERTDPR
jgi:hydrogenase maturation protease